MKVRLAKKAGFCMGVRRAMELALEAGYRHPDPVYTLGPLIHNPQVLDLLKGKGIRVLEGDCVPSKGTVIIRAHGVPPEVKERLEKSGCMIVDATCPRVIRVQAVIRKYAEQGYAAIIVGDRDHPEVIGLLGYSKGRGMVLTRPEQVEELPNLEKVIVVAQTTQDETLFQKAVERIRERFPESLVFNTICNATHERQEEVRQLSREVEAMVVVGGFDSGNTRRLASIAASSAIPCFHVETEEQLDKELLQTFGTVGVTAGASTPNWMIRKVVQELEKIRGKGEFPLFVWMFQALRFLLKSNLLIALGAGFLSLAGTRLSGIEGKGIYFTVAFLHIYAMHILNHLLDRGAAEYNDPDRSQFYRRHRGVFFATGTGAVFLSLLLAARLGWIPLIFLTAMSTLGILYSFQIVPAVWQRFTRMKKIKDIPASKTLSVALGWGAVTVLIPALAEGRSLGFSLIWAFFVVSLFVYVRSGLFDVLDIQGDMIVGKETLPILIGEEKTIRFLKGLSLADMAFLTAGVALGYLPLWGLWLLLSFCYQFLFLILYEKRPALPGSVFFETLVESCFFLAGITAS